MSQKIVVVTLEPTCSHGIQTVELNFAFGLLAALLLIGKVQGSILAMTLGYFDQI
jgi:hypothetical protein